MPCHHIIKHKKIHTRAQCGTRAEGLFNNYSRAIFDPKSQINIMVAVTYCDKRQLFDMAFNAESIYTTTFFFFSEVFRLLYLQILENFLVTGQNNT